MTVGQCGAEPGAGRRVSAALTVAAACARTIRWNHADTTRDSSRDRADAGLRTRGSGGTRRANMARGRKRNRHRRRPGERTGCSQRRLAAAPRKMLRGRTREARYGGDTSSGGSVASGCNGTLAHERRKAAEPSIVDHERAALRVHIARRNERFAMSRAPGVQPPGPLELPVLPTLWFRAGLSAGAW